MRLTMRVIIIVFALGILAVIALIANADSSECHTDTECQALCPDNTALLPPDHPDYCDGGY